jgi:hypothetical protein
MKIAAFFSLILALGSSSPQEASLVGSWRLDGPLPRPGLTFQWTAFSFKRDGSVDATYLPPTSPMLPPSFQRHLQTRTEHDRYEPLANNKVRIINGAVALTYSYDFKNGRLYLTEASYPDAPGRTVVFVRKS